MKTHIRIVGALHVAWNLLGLATGVLIALLYFAGTSAVAVGLRGAVPDPVWTLIVGPLLGLGVIGSCVLLAPSLPGFLAGIGVLGFSSWARWVLVVVSVFYLFVFPIGTLIGIYSLYVLLNDRAEFVFKGS